MYRILVATDGSEHCKKVIEETLLIAEPLKAEVTVLTVVGEYVFSPRVSVHFTDDGWDAIHNHLKAEAAEVVEQAAKPFKDKGLKTDTKVLIGHLSPGDAICETAGKGNYNLVVLGSRGLKGIKEAFMGSVSNKVAHCSAINVLIIK